MSRLATVRRGAAVTIATLLFPALTAACADRHPTEPQESDQVRNVVRSYPGGCVPEATVTYEGSLEKTLITFTPVDTACSSNYFDVSSFGMDMADPVATDSPQGNMRWDRASGANLQNLPSPGYAAGGLNSVYQAFVEFDPPVRSVSFHFSSPVENAHWGGMGGPLQIGVDSMPVYAVSRTPGTIQYTIWDWEKLHANVASWEQLDVWDSVTLNAPWNAIQWLWFDGPVYIDNLEITRAVGPAIQCTEAIRGTHTDCTIERTVDEVLGWNFVASNPPIDQGIEVSSPSSLSTWSGRAVIGGTVAATVVVDGDTTLLSGSLVVQPRESQLWSWGETDWPLSEDVEPLCTFTDWVIPSTTLLGVHRRIDKCAPFGNVQPPLDTLPTAGFSAQSVTDSGPNSGLWYVDSATYTMHHATELNPYIRHGHPPDTLTDNPSDTDWKKCKNSQNLQPGDTLIINFYAYNTECRPNENVNEMIAQALAHEGLGTNGWTSANANGHEARVRFGALDPINDPRQVVESLVASGDSVLASGVRAYLLSVDNRLHVAADTAHVYVNGLFSKPVWVYSTDVSQYQKFTPSF